MSPQQKSAISFTTRLVVVLIFSLTAFFVLRGILDSSNAQSS